jgi:hypothetical protein
MPDSLSTAKLGLKTLENTLDDCHGARRTQRLDALIDNNMNHDQDGESHSGTNDSNLSFECRLSGNVSLIDPSMCDVPCAMCDPSTTDPSTSKRFRACLD